MPRQALAHVGEFFRVPPSLVGLRALAPNLPSLRTGRLRPNIFLSISAMALVTAYPTAGST